MTKSSIIAKINNSIFNANIDALKNIEKSINNILSEERDKKIMKQMSVGNIEQTELFPGSYPNAFIEGKDIGRYDSEKGIYVLPVRYVDVEWRTRDNSNKELRKKMIPIRTFINSIGFISKDGLKKCRKSEQVQESKIFEFCTWLEKLGVTFYKRRNKFEGIDYEMMRDTSKMLGAFGCYDYHPRDQKKLLDAKKAKETKDFGRFEWVKRIPGSISYMFDILEKEDAIQLNKIDEMTKKSHSKGYSPKEESAYEKEYFGQRASDKKRRFAHFISKKLNVQYPYGPETNRDIDAFINRYKDELNKIHYSETLFAQ